MEATNKSPVGIGGWLVFPALGLIVTPFTMGFQFYRDLLPALTPEVWNAVTDPQSAAYHPLWAPVIIFEVLANLALIFFTLLLSWLFFSRSKRVPALFVLWLALLAGTQIVDQLLTAQIPALAEQPTDPAVMRDLARSIISAAVWIPYFLKSVRVKNTFIEPVS